MAILDHEHIYAPIEYIPDQRFLSDDEKTTSGLPSGHVIYTFEACSVPECTAVKVIDQSDADSVHVIDIKW